MADNTNKGGKMPRWFPVLLAVLLLVAIKLRNEDTADNAGSYDKPSIGGSSNVSGNIGGNSNNADTVQQGAAQNAHQASVLSAVPTELRSNYFLNQKEMGCCKNLSGKVAVAVVMISDSVGKWDAESVSELKTALDASGQEIVSEAAAYQVDLSLSFYYYEAKMSGDICSDENTDDWQNSALQSAGLPALDKLHNYLTERYSAKEAPVVFVFNKDGRPFVRSSTNEFLVLYARDDYKAFQHELSHVFGAKDFYYPAAVKAVASACFFDSIMNSGEKVDPFTAYLIGWTDTVEESSLKFLKDTNGITAAYMAEEREKEVFTGYGTKEYEAGTYTGDLVRGLRHGNGTMQYNNGSWYTGQWSYGSWTGAGTGKYTYESGSVYEGTFLNSKPHGTGTMRYSNGSWYEGQWDNGEWAGTGTGKCIYESGSVYEGGFLNGKRHGQGTYTYSNGSTYTGGWKDGEKSGNGTGKEFYDNGYYQGAFYNGKRHGQGTYVWSSGNTYTGQWQNGSRTGYGTYTWSDGRTKTGTWKNGEFVG